MWHHLKAVCFLRERRLRKGERRGSSLSLVHQVVADA
uniref:Uncharacterized protein n=1 Tax=Arundo donax TaxID=35708 RepID=A0A0A8XVT4_ARUDO